MHFRNCRLQKISLGKCLKGKVSENSSTLREATWSTGSNTAGIWTTASLPKLLITVKVTELEKVSFSATQNRKNVC